MADFSLTTVFVVPVSQTSLPSTGSTQDLTAGQFGLFDSEYAATETPSTKVSGGASPYFYLAQGRTNTYLQGSKRSDKIKGCSIYGCKTNVTEWYKVTGCPTPTNQITDVTDWVVKCGDVITITLRAHSSYIDTLYFNGLTRSVTVQAPCCECGGDPCDEIADLSAMIDLMVDKLEATSLDFLGGGTTGTNPDNISLSTFFTFENIAGTTLRITGKALTKYGVPCDVAAFPFEYDRMWFRTFVYSGPATTADFIVADNCNIVAEATVIQTSNYAKGTSAEIAQLEKNYYSYQAGYLKHLYRMAGYNGNFESWVSDGYTYDTFYIKFTELDQPTVWGDYIKEDEMVIVAVPQGIGTMSQDIEDALVDALGDVTDDSAECITTTTTTTAAPTTTTTTTTEIIG